LDYQDFSDDAGIIQKIKKAETYRTWADIEDLANTLSTLQTQFQEQQANVQHGMQEMFAAVDKFKKDEAAKKTDMNKEMQRIVADITKLKDYTPGSAPAQAPGSAAGQSAPPKFNSSFNSMDILTEVKAAMTKLLENKIVDLEFNLNNKIVIIGSFPYHIIADPDRKH
jgi:hypothetical protein